MSLQNVVSLAIPIEIEKRAKNYAEQTGKTFAQYVRESIKFYNMFHITHELVKQGEGLEAVELPERGGYFRETEKEVKGK